jgi:hypothetical protein
MKRRDQMKPNALEKVQYEVRQSEDDDGYQDVLQPNVKFASSRSRLFSMVKFLMMTQSIIMM